ncbi:hypothetical protein GGR13_000887 [Brevundimonas variabilis]|uniref:Uncharacterized protein n=1 Tax=Brevundimonas variabilis TaxID=74312 RepID=A0A7W9FDK7_9CAUL|nr:hypothetical protein [Brevundimonas variabilis]
MLLAGLSALYLYSIMITCFVRLRLTMSVF